MAASSDPDKAYLRSIPWCAKLIDDPAYTTVPSASREPKPTTEDSLLAETLNTAATIRACLLLYQKPPGPNTAVQEVRTLFSLGSGLNGHPRLCHGGLTATLLDEGMGNLLWVNKHLECTPPFALATATANLNINYRKPLPTPTTVLAVAPVRAVPGRKFFVEARIEDGDGAVLAEGKALWVGFKEARERL